MLAWTEDSAVIRISKGIVATKEALLLIPGVGSDHRLWEHQVCHLGDLADIRVEVPCRSPSRAEAVAELLQKAPDRFALAGQSYGGWLGQVVAATAPERVSKLMLFHTFSRLTDAHLETFRHWVDLIDQNHLTPSLQASLTGAVHPRRLKDRNFLETLYTMQQAFPLEGRRNQLQAIINEYETASLLPDIVCPTLVVHAREDSVFSLEEHQYMAQHITGAKLTILEECGHMGPLEQPQAVTALMRLWLSL
ncbi:hydrolase [Nitrospira sp.]|nr:hydrolase [Nitrospira sp.]